MKCRVSEDPKNSLGLIICKVEWRVLWHFRKYSKNLASLSLNFSLAFRLKMSHTVNADIVVSGVLWRGCALQRSSSVKTFQS